MEPLKSPADLNLSTDLPTSPETLMEKLDAQGIPYNLHHHPAVFTVEESNKLEMALPGCHTRNLFLKDKKGRMVLVTLSHDTRIDLNKLNVLLGYGRFSFGSPERLWQYLGVRPGSVTPFSIINDTGHQVELVLEEKMLRHDRMNVHPLLNTMTVGLAPDDFLRFLTEIKVTPRIVDLSTASP